MDVIDAIHQRRSVRDFTAEPVDDAVLLRLIDAGIWAPSAINEQPCHFTVVQDRPILDAISDNAKAHMLAAGAAPMPEHLREAFCDAAFQIFHHAPVLILISADPGGPSAVQDCAVGAQNLMLAAFAEGLGTCWIGSAVGWLQTREGKALLGLPAASMPVAPIIVGHPASQPPPPPRRQPRIKWVRSTPPELSALQKKDANALEIKLLDKARAALRSEPTIGPHFHPSELEIGSDGALVLAGEVESVKAKKLGLERVAALPGIARIADRLHVKPATRMTDAEIRVHLRDALILELAFKDLQIREIDNGKDKLMQAPPSDPKGSIVVEVNDGVVTLNGRVPGLTSKRLAGVMAWWMPGVRDVVNGIAVEPPEDDGPDMIEEAVRVTLERDPFVNASQVRVGVRDTMVLLTGLVPSSTEERPPSAMPGACSGSTTSSTRSRSGHSCTACRSADRFERTTALQPRFQLGGQRDHRAGRGGAP